MDDAEGVIIPMFQPCYAGDTKIVMPENDKVQK